MSKYEEHLDIVNVIDQYYDALVEYAFLDSSEERDNNPHLIEIVNRIASGNFNHNHQIKTECYGILTPYEYVTKMLELLLDTYDENRHVFINGADTDAGWVTISDYEYEICRREELRMIRDYYDKLVEIFTLV